ncbi:MAG: type II secretion system protein [Arenimonas sp.]
MNRAKMSGFTLIELVVVMIIIGVLAVAAVPRLLDSRTFDSRGFNDQNLAALRYAHKAAIAQRRTVCVSFSASSVTFTMASVAGSSTCNTNLVGPAGDSPFQITASPGVTYTASPSNFAFNGAGQASLGQTLQVNGQTNSITVEQDTGYVHR